MTKPVSTVPQTFATAASPLPLANLDSNFAYVITQLNDLATYSNYVADSGTLNALVLNFPVGITLSGLNVGTVVQFKPANNNTGATTLQLKINNTNVGSAAPVLDSQGNALTSGLLKNTVVYSAFYDGTNWVLQGVLSASVILPSYTGNALKYLQVNSGATDIVWSAVSGTPSPTGNNGRFLKVGNQSGVSEWDTQTFINAAFPDSRTFVVGTTTNASDGGIDVRCSTNGFSVANSTIRLYNNGLNDWGYISCGWYYGTIVGSFTFGAPLGGGFDWYTTPSGGVNTNRATLDVTGNFSLNTVGRGFRVKEGSNAKQGTAVLVGGTVTVSNTSVTANSRIFLTSQVDGGTPGFLRVSSQTASTSFVITSSSASDTSTVAYIIFEPA